MKFTDKTFIDTINAEIANSNNGDSIAKMEIVREFFTNANFRQLLSDTTFEIINSAARLPIVVDGSGRVVNNPHECPECQAHSPAQGRHFVGCSRR